MNTMRMFKPDSIGWIPPMYWGGADGTDYGNVPHDFESNPSVRRQRAADYFVNHGSTDGVWSLPPRGRPNGRGALPPGTWPSAFEIVEIKECGDDEYYRPDTVWITFLRPDAQGARIHIVTAARKVLVRPKGDKRDLQARFTGVREELEARGFRVVVQ